MRRKRARKPARPVKYVLPAWGESHVEVPTRLVSEGNGVTAARVASLAICAARGYRVDESGALHGTYMHIPLAQPAPPPRGQLDLFTSHAAKG